MATSTNPYHSYLSGEGTWEQMLLSAMPQEQYYGSAAGRRFGARSPRQQRYFQDAYGDIMQDWIGERGRAMSEGREPMTFASFLDPDDPTKNPWTKRYSALPQSARGVTGAATNPRTRFLYNF